MIMKKYVKSLVYLQKKQQLSLSTSNATFKMTTLSIFNANFKTASLR